MAARSGLLASRKALQLHGSRTLIGLPEELLDCIAMYICNDFTSLKNTRATCRDLARITTPYVFETVHITLSKKSMENFINIGLNNVLAPLVEELVFHGQIPPEFPDINTWRKYVHLGPEEEGLMPENSNLADYRRRDLSHKLEKDLGNLKQFYQAYKEYQRAPQQFNSCYSLKTSSVGNPMLYAYQYFPVAVGMLKNLQSAKVTSHDINDNYDSVWRNYRREILQGPREWTKYTAIRMEDTEHDDYELQGVTQLTCLLHALSLARQNNPLRSLKFATEGPGFWFQTQLERNNRRSFASSQTIKNSLALMIPAFANLRELAVTVLQSITMSADDHAATTLARFIRSASQLEVLYVKCMEVIHFGAPVQWYNCDLLAHPPPGSWPQLRELTFCASTNEFALKCFLREIAPSLRSLTLKHASFYESGNSWERLISEMPDFLALDYVYLEKLSHPSQDPSGISEFFECGDDLFSGFACQYQMVERYILRKTSERPPLDLQEYMASHGKCGLCMPPDYVSFFT